MCSQYTEDEIDYDKIIEYELSCLDDESDSQEKTFFENTIAENDSYNIVLDKISQAHEEFYKSCFFNANFDDEDDGKIDENKLSDNLDNRKTTILKSFNITYEDFVLKLPKISSELDEESDSATLISLDHTTNEDNSNDTTQAWINHEKLLQRINEEKWNQFDTFYKKFDERCASARTESNKLQESQLLQEKKRREILQTNMESELKLLEQRWKLDEAENKLKMMELDAEIEEERHFMIKLQCDAKEVINTKHTQAAIMIQKIFRKYRIRKRIGAQVDSVREKARQKIFNRNLIIAEKKASNKRAIELRKWKRSRDTQSKQKVVTPDLNIANEVYREDKLQNSEPENDEDSVVNDYDDDAMPCNLSSHVCNQDNNSNIFTFIEDVQCDDSLATEENNYCKNFGENIDKIESSESICKEIFNSHIIDQIDEINDKVADKSTGRLQIVKEDIKNSSINDNIISEKDANKNTFVDKNSEIFIPNGCLPGELTCNVAYKSGDSVIICDLTCISDLKVLQPDQKVFEGELPCNVTDKSDNSVHICDITYDSDLKVLQPNQKVFDENNYENIIQEGFLTKDVIGDDAKVKKEISDEFSIKNYSQNVKLEDINDISESIAILKESDVNKNEREITKPMELDDVKNLEEKVEEKIEDPVVIMSNVVSESDGVDFIKASNYDNESESFKNFKNDQIVWKNNDEMDGKIPEEIHLNVKYESMNDGNFLQKNENDTLQEDAAAEEDCSFEDRTQFLNEIFCGNKALIDCCLEWMNLRCSNCDYNNSGDIPTNILQQSPTMPKHFGLDPDFSRIITDSMPNSLIEFDKEPKSTCKSLTVRDPRLLSVQAIKHVCPSLQFLTVNDTSLNAFHSDYCPETLVHLNLDRNKLEWAYFGSDLSGSLTSISCSSNDLSDLPPGAFRRCHSLVYLDLSSNNFLDIVNIFKNTEPLLSLCYLSLNSNVLSSMANLSHQCPHLTHLYLSNNHIRSWTNEENFPYLIECDLSNNSLTKISRLSNTSLITRLDLSNNSLDCLEEFTKSWMPCLTVLRLMKNRLKTLPELHFPLLQDICLTRNYITDDLDVDSIFKDCPLISSIDFSDNVTSIGLSSRKFKNVIINDHNKTMNTDIPCPAGDFATKCYDFVDSIHNKSLILTNNMGGSTSIETSHKHRYHFYRCVRDTVEDFYNWMLNYLSGQQVTSSREYPCKTTQRIYGVKENDAAVKIQAFWKGHRTRKWYKCVLKGLNFETEKSFECFAPQDLSEFDENYFLGDWDSHCQMMPDPKEAWVQSNRPSLLNDDSGTGKMTKMCTENIDIPPAIIETSSRSDSSGYKQSAHLGKKGMEIMKEWGFEDPNSAKWMLQRAKKLKGKSDRHVKRENSGSRVVPDNHMSVTYSHRPQRISQFDVAPVSTVTLQPPSTGHSTITKSKIIDWLNDSEPVPVSGARNRSFLPVIENDYLSNKHSSAASNRRDSASTKLPPINILFNNK